MKEIHEMKWDGPHKGKLKLILDKPMCNEREQKERETQEEVYKKLEEYVERFSNQKSSQAKLGITGPKGEDVINSVFKYIEDTNELFTPYIPTAVVKDEEVKSVITKWQKFKGLFKKKPKEIEYVVHI